VEWIGIHLFVTRVTNVTKRLGRKKFHAVKYYLWKCFISSI